MARVTVYFFEMYRVEIDQMCRSLSRATLDAIDDHHGWPIMDTGIDVDEADLDAYGHYRPAGGAATD